MNWGVKAVTKQEFWTYVNDCIALTYYEYGCNYCPAKAYYDELNVACPATKDDYCSGICRDVYEKIEAQERESNEIRK